MCLDQICMRRLNWAQVRQSHSLMKDLKGKSGSMCCSFGQCGDDSHLQAQKEAVRQACCCLRAVALVGRVVHRIGGRVWARLLDPKAASLASLSTFSLLATPL